VVLTLIMPAVIQYTSPAVARTINDTYQNLNGNFTSKIYSPVYNATFNSSSGVKASGSLQIFSGLAFMFGEMYQVTLASFQGLPMIATLLGSLVQYSPLPDVNVAALIGLFIGGAAFMFIWWVVASWTKVEA
jgi:hypothetical protein